MVNIITWAAEFFKEVAAGGGRLSASASGGPERTGLPGAQILLNWTFQTPLLSFPGVAHFAKCAALSMDRENKADLRPTLWRTCRALANRRRLRLVRYVLRHPGHTVTEIADALGFTVATASEYLRVLNARGLLEAGRVDRFVCYGPGRDRSLPEAQQILQALQLVARRRKDFERHVFRQATAFTHLRRARIIRAIEDQRLTILDLEMRTRISRRALKRHLAKLRARGYLRRKGGRWYCPPMHSPLPKTLVRLCRER
jgi:DNA-binding MarR family transcriptional regulator